MEYLGQSKKVNQLSPMVSVCVTAYQHSAYIRECLESIISQKTTFPFEVVVGEDDSTDGTREICKEYADNYPDKIRLFLRNRRDVMFINGRATGRFNFLQNFKAARGKFIALCDGDDYWTDNLKLQQQYDAMQQDPRFGICVHETRVLTNQTTANQYFTEAKLMRVGKEIKAEFELKDYLNPGFLFHTSSFFARAENINPDADVYRISVCGDLPFFIQACGNSKIKYLSKPMSVYRKHQGSYSNCNKLKRNTIQLNYAVTVLKSTSKLSVMNKFYSWLHSAKRIINAIKFSLS